MEYARHGTVCENFNVILFEPREEVDTKLVKQLLLATFIPNHKERRENQDTTSGGYHLNFILLRKYLLSTYRYLIVLK